MSCKGLVTPRTVIDNSCGCDCHVRHAASAQDHRDNARHNATRHAGWAQTNAAKTNKEKDSSLDGLLRQHPHPLSARHPPQPAALPSFLSPLSVCPCASLLLHGASAGLASLPLVLVPLSLAAPSWNFGCSRRFGRVCSPSPLRPLAAPPSLCPWRHRQLQNIRVRCAFFTI